MLKTNYMQSRSDAVMLYLNTAMCIFDRQYGTCLHDNPQHMRLVIRFYFMFENV